jgi:hypothetical protein
VQDGLGDEAEYARFSCREAALHHGVEDDGHDAMDMAGRGEVSSGFEELRGESVEVHLCGGRADFGQVGVVGGDGLAAAASTGEEVAAASAGVVGRPAGSG